MNSLEPLLVASDRIDARLLELLDPTGESKQLLLTVPGRLPAPYEGFGTILDDPARAIPVSTATAHRGRWMEDLAASLRSVPQTSDWWSRIRRWIQACHASQVQVRVCVREPVFGQLLSTSESTILPPGPLSLHTPTASALTVRLTGSEHLRARAWFGGHWNKGQDQSEAFLQVLEGCWAGQYVDPEQLYYKVTADYFQLALEGLDSADDDNPMMEAMTDFQQEAYHVAKSILRRYGGVFLADVVGLGKTFIGLALLRHLQDRYGERALVVAPPSVCPAWEELAEEFRVDLRTLSHSQLDKLDTYAGREILVLDESHNFRNTGTQRFELLAGWLRPEEAGSHRKVILVSATPQNNRASDILAQIRLFPDTYSRLPFIGESIDDFFRAVANQTADIRVLLQHIVVRRTRSFIKESFPSSTIRIRRGPGDYVEKPLVFPTRVSGTDQCLRYRLDGVYDGDLYEALLGMLRKLEYPVHSLDTFVRPEHRGVGVFKRLSRAGTAMRGLYRVLLLKRLESSLVAFRISMERLKGRLDGCLVDMDRGLVRVRARSRSGDAADADDDLFEGEDLVGVSLFREEALRRSVQHDLELLNELLSRLQAQPADEDGKHSRLLAYLTERSPGTHKVIIFTQFADTARYLFNRLSGRFSRVALVTGGMGNALEMARRFAPVANRRPIDPEQTIDLLVTTDTLSEGVNLQDADTLINYDLHWNPVRLIQRAGRIDRIGSVHDEIHIASFLPERQLETSLQLESVLRARIEEFTRVFGEDSTVLPRTPEYDLDLDSARAAYTGEAFELADREDPVLDAMGVHASRIMSLRKTAPGRFDAIMAMEPGRRSLSRLTSSPPVGVTRAGWYWRFWSWRDGAARTLDDGTALDLLWNHAQAGAATNVASEPVDAICSFVEAARSQFGHETRVLREQRHHPVLSRLEQWVLDLLTNYRNSAGVVTTRREGVAKMIEWVRRGQYKRQLDGAARRWRAEELGGEAIFQEMKGLLRRFPLDTEELDADLVVGTVFGAS